MAITKITADVIDTGTITADNLHATLDLSSKTLTLPSAQTATTQSAGDNSTKVATTAYVETATAAIVDSAPGTLNTLNELAAALGDDANFSTTVTNSIAAKLPLAGGTLTGALTTNGVINTGTSHNFAINTPNSLRINIDSNDSATDQVFVIGNNQTAVDASNDVLFKLGENGVAGIGSGVVPAVASGNGGLTLHSSTGGTGNTGATRLRFTNTTTGQAGTDGIELSLDGNTGNFYIENRESSGDFIFYRGSERMRIDANGHVGIGRAPESDYYSGIKALALGNGPVIYASTSGNPNLTFNDNLFINSAGNNEYQTSNPGTRLEQFNGTLTFNNAPSGTAGQTATLTERFRIAADGTVGIGTSSPASNLHVETNTHANIRIQAGTNSSASLRLRNDAHDYDVNCQTNDNFAIYSHTAAAERFVITSSGHAIINGTTNASGDGLSNLTLGSGSGDAGISIYSGTSSVGRFMFADGTSGSAQYNGFIDFTHSDSSLGMGINGGRNLTINSSGCVLINKTSPTWSSSKLEVDSNARIGNIYLQGDSSNSKIFSGNAEIRLSSLEFRGGGSGLDFDVTLIKTGVGFTNMFKVDSPSGDTYTNDGTISSLSDERIKTDINDLADGLDIVKQLRPVTFKYNDTTEDEEGKKELGTADDTVRYGFIAQEVEAVAPHYVETSTRKINNVEVDDFKSLSTTRMIPMLLKSIQELSSKLDAAEARIEALEG